MNSIEKLSGAKRALIEAQSLDDIAAIHDIAVAAQTYAKAAKLGMEAQNEAAEVARRAERKAGEVLREMPKAQGKRTDLVAACNQVDDTPTLSELGINKTESHRWQQIASVPEETFEEYIQETKEKGSEITQAGLLRVARGQNSKDRPTPDLPDGKYRIIYADPPWKYQDHGVTQDERYGSTEWHYPTMTQKEMCELPISELAADDSVLFIWVTSPKLNEVGDIIEAWGFEYKTSFVWDKVKHNFGYYNSVRHEFLLVCGRGKSTPDIKQLFDSVQTIERGEIHSEKPEEFRQIIDTLYPVGKRIELFARKQINGWDVWGNEVSDGKQC